MCLINSYYVIGSKEYFSKQDPTTVVNWNSASLDHSVRVDNAPGTNISVSECSKENCVYKN